MSGPHCVCDLLSM